MKIIIAGVGKIGTMLTKQLSSQGYEITVIDTRAFKIHGAMEKYDVMGIEGNGASMPVLLQAGVKGADLLIVTTDADEKNLLSCMTAQGINRQLHTIARVRNPDYIQQMYGMLDVFSLSLAINPESQAAREMERLIKYPGFSKRQTFARGRVEMVELRLDGDSRLCGLPLTAIQSATKCNVLVCIVIRGGEVIIPDGAFVLQQGDHIFVTASTDQLSLLLKNLGIITRKIQQVLLCGGGRVCGYLAQNLIKSGISVRIIEQDAAKCQALAEQMPKVHIIQGDASDQEVLSREGITRCDALISMTGMDELNMVISMYARKLGVPHVITKLSHMEPTHPLLAGLDLGSVVSPKEYCGNAVVRYVRAMKNQTGAAISVHSIAEGQAEALEFLVEEDFTYCKKPLKTMPLRPKVLIAAITRGVKTQVPDGNASIEVGDVVIVVKSGDTVIHHLNDILQ